MKLGAVPRRRNAGPLPAWVAGGVVFALTLAAYWPALRGGFIWNDADYVTRAALRSWQGLGRIWWDVGATEQYYPLLHSAFWVEHRLWGDSALGYHLANVLQHATAACLFAFVLRRLLGQWQAAWLGGLIFALHPVGVESVAWISEQKNTLSTVFYLGAALSYLRFRDRLERRWYGAATGLFVAACLSKTVAATLPAALLVVLWWRQGRLAWRVDVRPLLPWFVFGAGAGLFSAWVEHSVIGASGAAFDLTLLQRSLLAGHIVWFYLGKLIWPANLIFIYPHWTVSTAAMGQYLYSLGVVAGLLLLGLTSRRSRGPLAAALIFGGTLFPVLGVFNVYAFIYSYVADHWQYLASLSVIALAVAGWERWEKKGAGARIAAAGLICLLFALTWRQSRMYRDIELFYRTTLEKNPTAWMAHNNLGTLLQRSQDTAGAIDHYRQALGIDPNLAEVHFNLGNSLADSGHPDEALPEYREALRLKPAFPEAHYSVGMAAARAGKWADAIAEFKRAVALRANFPEAENSLGFAYAAIGQPAEAEVHYHQALRLRPTYAAARSNLAELENNWGNQLLGDGKPDQAMPHFTAAIQLRPNYPEAFYNQGVALAQSGRGAEAIPRYEHALQLRPNYPEAENNLGAALAGAGRTAEAITHYQNALRLRPDYPEARYNLDLARRK